MAELAPAADDAECDDVGDGGGTDAEQRGADEQRERPAAETVQVRQQGGAELQRARVDERHEPRKVEPRSGDEDGGVQAAGGGDEEREEGLESDERGEADEDTDGQRQRHPPRRVVQVQQGAEALPQRADGRPHRPRLLPTPAADWTRVATRVTRTQAMSNIGAAEISMRIKSATTGSFRIHSRMTPNLAPGKPSTHSAGHAAGTSSARSPRHRAPRLRHRRALRAPQDQLRAPD